MSGCALGRLGAPKSLAGLPSKSTRTPRCILETRSVPSLYHCPAQKWEIQMVLQPRHRQTRPFHTLTRLFHCYRAYKVICDVSRRLNLILSPALRHAESTATEHQGLRAFFHAMLTLAIAITATMNRPTDSSFPRASLAPSSTSLRELPVLLLSLANAASRASLLLSLPTLAHFVCPHLPILREDAQVAKLR